MESSLPGHNGLLDRVFRAVQIGLLRGWRGYWWLLKILVPVSFATFVLEASGCLHRLDFLLQPAMGLLGLPPQAALVLLIGMLTGIYGAIAAMAVLSLTQAEMTLIAIFLLISHGLIQEGIVQSKSGFHWVKATAVRIVASVLTVLAAGRVMDTTGAAVSATVSTAAETAGFGVQVQAWGVETVILAAKILLIIMVLMVVLELMKSFDLMTVLVRRLSPVLKVMGLAPDVGFLWLAAGIFGISYGAAVIVEETRTGAYQPEDLARLHVSIGINHAMIEDPALFLAVGIGAFWLWVPRILAAIAATHLYSLWRRGRRRWRSAAARETARVA